MLSNTIKQKRKEKAGKWEVPLPKVRRCSGRRVVFLLSISAFVVMAAHLQFGPVCSAASGPFH